MKPDWFVIADDLTGALEVGAKFAAKGQAAVVADTVFPHPLSGEDLRVLVVDAETRHLEGAVAERIVFGLACASRSQGIRYLYKKTDSALRGNIGRELNGIAAAFPGEPILYAPAYPGLGRTVKDGSLFIDGIPAERTEMACDPLNPIESGHIPTMLKMSGCRIPVVPPAGGSAEFRPESCVLLHDGQTEDDLRRSAVGFFASHRFRIAAGPAGLAQYLADYGQAPCQERVLLPALRSCAVISGSLHEASRRQLEYARAQGWVSAGGDIAAANGSARWVLLNPPAPATEGIRGIAVRAGPPVGELLRAPSLDGIVVFGGDTAYGIYKALGSPALYPFGEVMPGVPISRIRREDVSSTRDARTNDLYLVTKAGSFGEPDVLARIRARLDRT